VFRRGAAVGMAAKLTSAAVARGNSNHDPATSQRMMPRLFAVALTLRAILEGRLDRCTSFRAAKTIPPKRPTEIS